MARAVVIKQYGDREIAGAIADGMIKALDDHDIEIVKQEIHDQRVQRSLLRVAVNNTKSDDDYACMTAKARWSYESPTHGWLYNVILGTWGLFWYCVSSAYEYLSDWNRS